MLTPFETPTCYCCGAHIFQAKLYRESHWGISICHGCIQTMARWFYLEHMGDEHVLCQALCDTTQDSQELYHIYVISLNGPANSFSTASFKRLENFSALFP
jgi:hypothetical protein